MGQQRKLLIVDDDPAIRRLLHRRLADTCEIREASCGEEALRIAVDFRPNVILLDIMMPGLDGYATCLRLKQLAHLFASQVVMVSGRSAPDELSKAFEVGADDYLIKPVDPVELRSRVDVHFRLHESRQATNELEAQIESNHRSLRELATESREQILAVQDVAVLALAKVAESRDNETGQHIIRLRDYANRIGEKLRLEGPYQSQVDSTFLADLFRSSPLHDIGKVGIPDSILLKPGRLTSAEFELMKRHTIIGGNILLDSVMELPAAGFLSMAAKIAHFHHERWDGQGYPSGLAGEEIPLAARIVSVADVYDALTSERPYKQAWPLEKARSFIEDASGAQFDPSVVAAFVNCLDQIQEIQIKQADKAQVAAGAMSFAEYDLEFGDLVATD